MATDKEPDMDEWLPDIVESKKTNPQEAAAENQRLEWLYREDLKTYSQRKTTYHKNKKKAFSFLIGECAKNMQEALE